MATTPEKHECRGCRAKLPLWDFPVFWAEGVPRPGDVCMRCARARGPVSMRVHGFREAMAFVRDQGPKLVWTSHTPGPPRMDDLLEEMARIADEMDRA